MRLAGPEGILSIASFELVDSKRITRTRFEYTYRAGAVLRRERRRRRRPCLDLFGSESALARGDYETLYVLRQKHGRVTVVKCHEKGDGPQA